MKALILAAAAAVVLAGPALAQTPRGDADGDGALSLAEFKTLQGDRLMRLDGDGDGKVSLAEWSAQRKGGKGDPARAFRLMDRNKDGGLDHAEIEAVLERRFARMDANKDGSLSPDERQAQMAQMKGRRGAGAVTP